MGANSIPDSRARSYEQGAAGSKPIVHELEDAEPLPWLAGGDELVDQCQSLQAHLGQLQRVVFVVPHVE